MSVFRRFTYSVLLAVCMAVGPVLVADTLTANQELGTLSSPNSAYTLTYYFYGWSGPPNPPWGWTTWLTWNGWNSVYDTSDAYGGVGTHTPQWAGDCHHAIMQNDGNFVCYTNDYSTAVWETTTNGHSGAYLAAQNDGNLVVYNSSNVAIWSVY